MNPTTDQEWMDQQGILCSDRDDCEFCLGNKGGTKGNENVVHGIVMCDYCYVLFMKGTKALQKDSEKRVTYIESHVRALQEQVVKTTELLVALSPTPIILIPKESVPDETG